MTVECHGIILILAIAEVTVRGVSFRLPLSPQLVLILRDRHPLKSDCPERAGSVTSHAKASPKTITGPTSRLFRVDIIPA
jgi:hypothetical protein